MSHTPSGESFDTTNYQNPQQDWVCGHHADGSPCPIGPGGSGECLVAKICVPVHADSAWHCTRAGVWGGRCSEGPVPDPACPDQKATCPHQPPPCQPTRSLRNKRRLLTGITAAAALGCCLVILGGSSGNSNSAMNASTAIISPGPLSAHHATMDQGCAACHSAAAESPLDLLHCAFGSKGGIQESHKCLECHNQFGDHALHPHSLDPNRLAGVTERLKSTTQSGRHTTQQRLARMLPTHRTTAVGELACSTCHHEHRGAEYDLTRLTNSQCQTCHASTFHGFTDGHPEFPERQRAFLYFDHVTHLQTHFPNHHGQGDQESQMLKCSDCHVQDATGTSMILSRFENICAECHSGQIADDHMPINLRMPGSVFLSLNPLETLNQSESLPPFMEILLLADEVAAAALSTLRHSESSDSEISAARESYALSTRRLVHELVTDRERAVTTRLQSVLGDGHRAGERSAVVAGQLADSGFFAVLQVAQKKWLPRLPEEFAQIPDAIPRVEASSNRDRVSSSSSAFNANPVTGAWAIGDDFTLRYRSRGHADALLRDWLSFAAATAVQYPNPPNADSTGAFDRLLQGLAAPEATGHCMKCHTLDSLAEGQLRINWSSRQVLSTATQFTKFAHGPHVTLLSSEQQALAMGSSPDTRCETCHAVQHQQPVLRKAEFLLEDWMPNPNFAHASCIGLNSVGRDSCVKCHTQDLAGDNCLQCHNYHVHAGSMKER